MIEAKEKEQAVFDLYRIYGLEGVIWENLRPPKPDAGFADDEPDECNEEGQEQGAPKKTKSRKKGI